MCVFTRRKAYAHRVCHTHTHTLSLFASSFRTDTIPFPFIFAHHETSSRGCWLTQGTTGAILSHTHRISQFFSFSFIHSPYIDFGVQIPVKCKQTNKQTKQKQQKQQQQSSHWSGWWGIRTFTTRRDLAQFSDLILWRSALFVCLFCSVLFTHVTNDPVCLLNKGKSYAVSLLMVDNRENEANALWEQWISLAGLEKTIRVRMRIVMANKGRRIVCH